MIARATAVKLIMTQGIIFMLLLGGGLQIVKEQATQKATASALYATNHTGCAIRKIVAPQLAAADRARHDMTIPESQRKRAETAYRKTKQALDVWTTIPEDFDCNSLPKTPPQL